MFSHISDFSFVSIIFSVKKFVILLIMYNDNKNKSKSFLQLRVNPSLMINIIVWLVGSNSWFSLITQTRWLWIIQSYIGDYTTNTSWYTWLLLLMIACLFDMLHVFSLSLSLSLSLILSFLWPVTFSPFILFFAQLFTTSILSSFSVCYYCRPWWHYYFLLRVGPSLSSIFIMHLRLLRWE